MVTNSALDLLDCRPSPEGVGLFLRKEPLIPCWGKEHAFAGQTAALSLLVFCAGFPTALCYYMHLHRKAGVLVTGRSGPSDLTCTPCEHVMRHSSACGLSREGSLAAERRARR